MSENKLQYSTRQAFGEYDTEEDVPTSVLIFTSQPVYDHGMERSLVEGQLRKVVENFNKGVLGRKVPVNYDHPGSRMADSVAAGWITQLNDGKTPEGHYGIYADITWNPTGRQKIFDREYLYTSIGIYFNYIDYMDGKTEHGPTLYELSLTNRPANLNIGAIREFSEYGTKKIEGDEMTEQEKLEFSELKKLNETLTAKNETLEASFSEKIGEFEKEKAEFAKIKSEFAKTQRSAELDKLIEAKSITPAQKEKAMEMNEDAYSGFTEAIALTNRDAYNSEPTSKVDNPSATDGMEHTDPSQELNTKAEKYAAEHKVDLKEAYSAVLSADKGLSERYESALRS